MGFIKEPKGVDFYVIDRQPTEKEAKMLSERIRQEKAERAKNPDPVAINSGNLSDEDSLDISKRMFILKAKNKKDASAPQRTKNKNNSKQETV